MKETVNSVPYCVSVPLTRRDTVALVLSLSWGSVGRLFHTIYGVSYLSRSFGQLLNRKSMMKNLIPAYRPEERRGKENSQKTECQKWKLLLQFMNVAR